MDNITTHIATDGTVYLRTQHGESAAEIAESLKPYVGRMMSADLPNLYGHYKRYNVVLQAVDGDDVTVYCPNYDHTATLSAFDAFGSHCTMIKKEDQK